MNKLTKKRISLLLAVAMTLCLTACGPSQSNQTPTASPTPSSVSVEQQVEQMLPMMDSVIRSHEEGGFSAHDATDAAYVWSVLYHLCVNYAEVIPSITVDVTAGQLQISSESIQSLYAVCFHGATALPTIPAENHSVSYNALDETYSMRLSDSSQTSTVLQDVGQQEDGQIRATAAWVDMETEQSIATYIFTFVAQSSHESNAYPLSIISVQKQ